MLNSTLRNLFFPSAGLSRRTFWQRISIIVFVLLLTALTAQWSVHNEIRLQKNNIHRVIEVHALALRGAAAKYNYLPFTVAQHPDMLEALAHPDDPAARQRANNYVEMVNLRAGSDALYLISAQGKTLAASNWNTQYSFVGQSYVNRPYFRDGLAGRTGHFYGVGQTTGEPGLFLSAPVFQGDSVVGVVAVKVSLRPIAQAWNLVRDPIFLTDVRGIVFLGSVQPWLYRSTRTLDADELSWVSNHRQYGDLKIFPLLDWVQNVEPNSSDYIVYTNLDGKSRQFLAVNEVLPELGWTLTVMADYSRILDTRDRTLMQCGLCAALLLFGGLYWQLRERHLAEQRNVRCELEIKVRERTVELNEAHAFRKAMEDSLMVGMCALDLQGRIVYVNPALCTMTGYCASELLGSITPHAYWHPEEVNHHWQESAGSVSGQVELSGIDSRIRHSAGHDVLITTYTARLINAQGVHSGWMSTVVDVTEKKRVASRQRQYNEQLQHAQRLASLGEMASTLAHELNQPLAALSNFASAARAFADQGKQELLIHSLDKTVAQAQRAAEIVRRISGFVRRRTGGMEECVFATLVTNVVALLQGELRQQQARVVVRIPNQLPALRGDRVLLEQVLLNLVMNSLQAMQATPVGRRVVEIDVTTSPGRLVIHVADRGVGIDAALAEQVFVPFFTTKPNGLGLGLNICRTILESHRGHLFMKPRPCGGTVFTLELECQQ